MKALKILAAVCVLSVPMLIETAPAQALTAHQYQAQGHGRYVSSTKRGSGYHRYHRWHRHYRHHRHY